MVFHIYLLESSNSDYHFNYLLNVIIQLKHLVKFLESFSLIKINSNLHELFNFIYINFETAGPYYSFHAHQQLIDKYCYN